MLLTKIKSENYHNNKHDLFVDKRMAVLKVNNAQEVFDYICI